MKKTRLISSSVVALLLLSSTSINGIADVILNSSQSSESPQTLKADNVTSSTSLSSSLSSQSESLSSSGETSQNTTSDVSTTANSSGTTTATSTTQAPQVNSTDDSITTGTWGTAPTSFDSTTGTLTVGSGNLNYSFTLAKLLGEIIIPSGQNVTSIVFTGPVVAPANSSNLFSSSDLPEVISIIGLNYLNTSNVTDFSYMFSNLDAVNSLDISGFDTHNGTNFSGMFQGMSSLTSLDVSNFDTSQNLDFSLMFHGMSSLTDLKITGLNTSNGINFYSMFSDDSNLISLDVSNFDTHNGTNFSGMFAGLHALTSLDLSSFDTQNAADMRFFLLGSMALQKLSLGSNFVNKTGTDANLASVSSMNGYDSTKYTGNWQNVGTGTDALPNGTIALTSDQITGSYYNGATMAGTYVWQPLSSASVTYIDQNTGTVLSTDNLSGVAGTTSDYQTADKIRTYENEGYVLSSNNYPATGVNFDFDSGTSQDFVVYLSHGTEVTTDEKTINQTIHYVYSDGTEAAPDATDSVSFTRTENKDLVTGAISYGDWTSKDGDTNFESKDSPTISGYSPDKAKSDEIKNLTATSEDNVQTITYSPASTPTDPSTPESSSTPDSSSSTSESSTTPDSSSNISNPSSTTSSSSSTKSTTASPATSASTTATPMSSASAINSTPAASKSTATLPKTGDNSKGAAELSLLGILESLLAAVSYVFISRKKRQASKK
ncbi:mucin-binding protein [Lactococcus lactis]|uniref:mucin-binding protein n=1 Tax=Lactococcus lactis TaxID=1358 RepID=UPI00223AF17C|nr:BspA family leucine-rich repeat surface protein [Lactococcus lactis]